MTMVFPAAFLLALIFAWYENKFAVRDALGRPLFYSRYRSRLFLVGLLVAFVSVAGIFLVYGLFVALSAFFIYWIFFWATSRIYFNREVQLVAARTFELYQLAKAPVTESEARNEATLIVTARTKAGG
jgi:hypothetical protein